jgi:hypothetical protein
MGNRILAVVIGAFAAMFIIGGLEQVVPLICTVPAHVKPIDKEAFEAIIRNTPFSVFLCLITANAIGCFTGGFAGALVAKKNRQLVSLIIGVLILSIGIANFVRLKHPLWFVIASLIVYLPAAHLGGMLAQRIRKTKHEPDADKDQTESQADILDS